MPPLTAPAAADDRIPAWGRTVARFALILWPIAAVWPVAVWMGDRVPGGCGALPAVALEAVLAFVGSGLLYGLTVATGRRRRLLLAALAPVVAAWVVVVVAVVPSWSNAACPS